MIYSDKIVTTLNEKNVDGEYVRYNIGSQSNNISYALPSGYKDVSLKAVLDSIQDNCFDENFQKFHLRYPLTIKNSNLSSDSVIYNGMSAQTIDLSKFLINTTKWNNLSIDDSDSAYKEFSCSAGDQIQDLSFEKGSFKLTKRSSGNGYSRPKYSAALSYRYASLCKMVLPKGKYYINYGIQVVNKYDKKLTNKIYTPNSGSSNYAFFSATNGTVYVDPGIVSATLCNETTLSNIEQHYYKDYPNDNQATTDQYFISGAARSTPIVEGTLSNSAYTNRAFILNVSNQNSIFHIIARHWNTPTSKITTNNGLFIDSNGKGRIVCPIGFWMQILALEPIS